MALIVARENKELLIGERAHETISNSILALASSPGVEKANGALIVHLAPDQIVVTLSLEFSDSLRTPELEQCVEALERPFGPSTPRWFRCSSRSRPPGPFMPPANADSASASTRPFRDRLKQLGPNIAAAPRTDENL